MKEKLNNKELKNGLILVAFGILFYMLLSNLNVVLKMIKEVITLFSPFLIGLMIAFVLNVPMSMIEKWLEKRKKIKRKGLRRMISLSLSILMVLAIILIVVALIIPDLGKTITSFVSHIPILIKDVEQSLQNLAKNNQTLQNWLQKIDFRPEAIQSQLEIWLKSAGTGILTNSLNFVFSLFSILSTGFIAFVFACYVLAEKEKLAMQFKMVLQSFLKENTVKNFFRVTALANTTFSKFISGQCLDALILGLLMFIGMVLFSFPYALSISVLISLTALIPVFGAFIAMFVGALLISSVSIEQAIYFIIYFLIIQQIEGNFIYPKVVGSSVGLPAIWTIMAVTIGGSCFGIFGMLISVPVSSILYALAKEWIKKRQPKTQVKIQLPKRNT